MCYFSRTMKWVTIRTFTVPTQAMVACTVLQNEGIDHVLQDELTVQVDPFYSNAIGGVKLQVPEHQAQKALEVLQMAGFDEKHTERPTLLQNFTEQLTSGVPFVKQLDWRFRFVLLIAVLFLVLVIFAAALGAK